MFDNLQDQQTGGQNQGDGAAAYKRPTPPPIPGVQANPQAAENPKPEPAPSQSVNNSQVVEDMFSETAKKEKPLIFQPKQDLNPGAQFGGINMEQSKVDPYTGEAINSKNKTIVLALMLISLMLVGIAGWYAYKMFFSKLTTSIVDTAPSSETLNINTNTSDPIDNTSLPNNKSSVIGGPDGPIDTDGDGLSDSEEMSLGTNYLMTDTDGDGLFDREEVKVYKTDPLDTDTDKDGYSDGKEVEGLYNPNGEGKLLNIE